MQIKSGKFPIPRMVLFCPSAKCNANCPYCIYGKENKSAFIMEEKKAFDVINQLSDFGVRAVDVCGGGEPLITPYADTLFYHIHRLNMKFGVITNGINFQGDNMKQILNNGTYFRVSLDSANPEVYGKNKGVNKVEAVKKNLLAAYKYKHDNNLKCISSIKILLTANNNPIELTETLTFICKEMPKLQHLGISCAMNIPKELEFPEAAKPGTAQLITELLVALGFPIERLKLQMAPTSIDHQCWLTPLHGTIMADGKMYLCCYYVDREEKHCIGNIHEAAFKDIWGSERHKEALKSIEVQECNKYSCKFHGHHSEIECLIKKDTPDFI